MFLSCGSIAAQQRIDTAFLLPRKHHAWGRFDVGAWKKVRVRTETLNDRGEVVGESIAETVTRLDEVDDRGYRIRSVTSIMVGGREVGTQTTTLWQGFGGENEDEEVSAKIIKPASVRIGSQAVDVQLREFEFRCQNMRRTGNIHYSPRTVPHVLKGETIATDPDGMNVKFKTSIKVLSLDHEQQFLEEDHRVAKVETKHETPKSKVTTLELFSAKVPGGIVASESEERDLNGQVVSRSTLELLDYGVTSPPPPKGLFNSGRFFRRRGQR